MCILLFHHSWLIYAHETSMHGVTKWMVRIWFRLNVVELQHLSIIDNLFVCHFSTDEFELYAGMNFHLMLEWFFQENKREIKTKTNSGIELVNKKKINTEWDEHKKRKHDKWEKIDCWLWRHSLLQIWLFDFLFNITHTSHSAFRRYGFACIIICLWFQQPSRGKWRRVINSNGCLWYKLVHTLCENLLLYALQIYNSFEWGGRMTDSSHHDGIFNSVKFFVFVLRYLITSFFYYSFWTVAECMLSISAFRTEMPTCSFISA